MEYEKLNSMSLSSDSFASSCELPTHDELKPAHQLPQPEHSKRSFKIIATLVAAVKRFEKAINPTYTYGVAKEAAKEDTCMPAPAVLMAMATNDKPCSSLPKAASAMRYKSGRVGTGRTVTGRSASGRPAGSRHGCKGALLFKPLPPLLPQGV